MSPAAQLTSEQLKEIIEEEQTTDQCTREFQEQVDGEEFLDPADTISVLSTVLITTTTNLNINVLMRWSGC